MKYQVFISGAPKNSQARPTHRGGTSQFATDGTPAFSGDGTPHISGDGAPADAFNFEAQMPKIRHFPPVLQMLTNVEPSFERQMKVQALAAFKQGKDLNHICEELYYCALSFGYDVVLGVQEIYSTRMPSFPNQTVLSTLLMVDAKKKPVAPGYRRRWAG